MKLFDEETHVFLFVFFKKKFLKFYKSVQQRNHMFKCLGLAGCGERIVLSSQTVIRWHLLFFCEFGLWRHKANSYSIEIYR